MGRRSPSIRRAAVVALAVVVLGTAPTADGQSDDDRRQLERLRQRIASLERRLDDLGTEAESARLRQREVELARELAEARVEHLELELAESLTTTHRLRGEVERLQLDLEERREALTTGLRMAAILGRPGPLQLLADAAEGGRLEEAVDVVAVLVRGQLALVEEYRELAARHRERLGELSVVVERARRESARLVERRGELEVARAAAAARLERVERERTVVRRDLDDSRRRAEALQRLLERLGGRERPTLREGIRSYRGALPWPAPGRVVRRFGRHYLPEYATYTVNNGVRMAVPPGTPVRATFPGVVAYARWFEGYGNMVVLDHGDEVYTLAAGLGSIGARVDQRVGLGAALGTAGPATGEGNLYFEIRVDGRPVDPLTWLKLTEGSS